MSYVWCRYIQSGNCLDVEVTCRLAGLTGRLATHDERIAKPASPLQQRRNEMKRMTVFAASVVLLGVMIAPTVATAASDGAGASGWHVGSYNSSGRALSMSQAAPSAGGVAQFNFTSQPNTALLITTQGSSILLGKDVGKTVTATFTISGATGTFSAYPDQCYPNGNPPNVRLFFETSNAGGFAYSNYWWADDASSTLANGTITLTAKVDPTAANWSDWGGELSGANTSTFNAAAGNVTGVGLSFGGYCHYESGVGTSDGSGTFTLSKFSVS